MKCTICNKPIELVPTAKQRAERYGHSPEYYTKLFTQHGACLVAKRSEESRQLLKKLTETK